MFAVGQGGFQFLELARVDQRVGLQDRDLSFGHADVTVVESFVSEARRRTGLGPQGLLVLWPEVQRLRQELQGLHQRTISVVPGGRPGQQFTRAGIRFVHETGRLGVLEEIEDGPLELASARIAILRSGGERPHRYARELVRNLAVRSA